MAKESILIVIAIVSVGCLNVNTGNKEIHVDRVDGNCLNSSETLMIIDYSSFKNVANRLYINGTITVKENIISPPLFTMHILKCKSKNDFASCSEFYSLSTKQYCKLISSNSGMWAPFFKNIKPPFKCPLKKGIYSIVNSSFDLTAFLLLPDDGHVWKVRGEMFDGQTAKRILCLLIESHVEKKNP